VNKAFAEGAKKVLVIDVQDSAVSTLTGIALRVLSARQGSGVRAAVARFIAREDDSIAESSSVVVCRPHGMKLRNSIDTDSRRTMQAIEQSYLDMRTLKF
jgi:hypothetical protein